MSLEKRAFSGIVAGGANFAVTMGLTFVSVPLLLRLWGKETYGAWLALMAACSLLTMLDAGHQNYLGNEFNKDHARGGDNLRRNLASGLRMAYVLGSTQLLIACVVVSLGLTAYFVGVEPSVARGQHLGSAFIMLVAYYAVFSAPSGILVRLYPMYGLYSRSQWIGLVQRTALQYVVVLTVAFLGGGIGGFAVVYVAVGLAFAVFWVWEFRRMLAGLYPWWRGGNWSTAWHNMRRSTVLTANGVMAQSATNGLSLVIAATMAAAQVPAFTTLRTVANTFYQATGIITQPLVPDLVRFHMKEEWTKLLQTLQGVWLASGAAMNLGLVLLLPWVQNLFELWTQNRLTFNFTLFQLLALSVVVRNAYAPLCIYLTGLNSLGVQVAANTAQAVSTLGLSLILAPRFGLNAFGLGVLFGECLALWIYLRATLQNGGLAGQGLAREFTQRAMLPVVVVGLVFAACFFWRAEMIFISGGGGLALVALYSWHWQRLPLEVKQRCTSLVWRKFARN